MQKQKPKKFQKRNCKSFCEFVSEKEEKKRKKQTKKKRKKQSSNSKITQKHFFNTNKFIQKTKFYQ